MRFLKTTSILGVLGVGLGAFGAHALKETLANAGYAEVWKTAVLYHLIHTVALLALANLSDKLRCTAIGYCWTGGIILFSGSLYALSITHIKQLGAITPLGGLLFITGWALLMFPKKAS